MGQHRHSRELFFAAIVARDFVPDMSGSGGFRLASFPPSFFGSKRLAPTPIQMSLVLRGRTRSKFWHGLSALSADLVCRLIIKLARIAGHLQASLKLAVGGCHTPGFGLADAQIAISGAEPGPLLD